MVWIAFALMTAAAVLCAAWPLVRPRRDAGLVLPEVQASTDAAFYRQQLAELDADVDRGLLAGSDADGVRAELGRRLLSASERSAAATSTSGVRHLGAAVLVAGVISLTAVALYAKVGHPDEPDEPLSARAADRDDFASAMAKMEAHLDMNPDDGRGSELIAPIYLKTGRFDAAARALRNAIRVLGPTPSREAALGQALVMEADGVVTGEARQVFDAALKGDPAMPQARFFEGLAALQDGDKAKARTMWTALVDEAPPEAPLYRDPSPEVGGPRRHDSAGAGHGGVRHCLAASRRRNASRGSSARCGADPHGSHAGRGRRGRGAAARTTPARDPRHGGRTRGAPGAERTGP